MVQVVEIPTSGRQGPIFPMESLAWLAADDLLTQGVRSSAGMVILVMLKLLSTRLLHTSSCNFSLLFYEYQGQATIQTNADLSLLSNRACQPHGHNQDHCPGALSISCRNLTTRQDSIVRNGRRLTCPIEWTHYQNLCIALKKSFRLISQCCHAIVLHICLV